MTKNLKLAIAILATVTSMSANAQKKAAVKTTKPKTEVKTDQTTTESKTAKPTKQETMDWIAGKMKEYLAEDREFISYNNGVVIIKKEWRPGIFCTTTYDLNKVTGITNEYSTDFYVSGNQIVFVHCDNEQKNEGTYGSNISISGPNYNKYPASFNFTSDDSMKERVRKAFVTLIEYNSTKKSADEKF